MQIHLQHLLEPAAPQQACLSKGSCSIPAHGLSI